jgi:hypothetical protein
MKMLLPARVNPQPGKLRRRQWLESALQHGFDLRQSEDGLLYFEVSEMT